MRWINSLERRFGFLAVPGLIRVVVALNAVVYLMLRVKPEFIDVLTLEPHKVLAGEVWRLVSFVFIPQVSATSVLSPLWALLYLNFLWLMGEGLEQAWGSFKLNLFYWVGILGTIVAVLGLGANDITGFWLNTSLFFAFATLFPNYPILLFFILPVAAKWIALVSFAFLLLQFVAGDLSVKAEILVAFSNYIVFFGPEWVRQWRAHRRVAKRRQGFQVAQKTDVDETLHHCKMCGSTEISHPERDFRVAADGEEYCTLHLPMRQGEGASPSFPEKIGIRKD